ncbi:hypothetical protein AMECASPLE_031885 [Ameca splendens]|uniref:Uncharacterized protein n=1 Tax=Ameca splendens TaxID=208324 RepID=A0ABV0XVG5_9TELE
MSTNASVQLICWYTVYSTYTYNTDHQPNTIQPDHLTLCLTVECVAHVLRPPFLTQMTRARVPTLLELSCMSSPCLQPMSRLGRVSRHKRPLLLQTVTLHCTAATTTPRTNIEAANEPHPTQNGRPT